MDGDAINVGDSSDLVKPWAVWTEDFSRKLERSEYPLTSLIRTQTPFNSRKIGIIDPETGEKLVFDVLGEAIRDEVTGEFLAGVIICRDITVITTRFAEQVEQDEHRFQVICESLPQIVRLAMNPVKSY